MDILNKLKKTYFTILKGSHMILVLNTLKALFIRNLIQKKHICLVIFLIYGCSPSSDELINRELKKIDANPEKFYSPKFPNAEIIPVTKKNSKELNYIQLAGDLQNAVTKGQYHDEVKKFMNDSFEIFELGNVGKVEDEIEKYLQRKEPHFIIKYKNEYCGIIGLHSSGVYYKNTCDIAYFCNPTKVKFAEIKGLFTVLISKLITKLFLGTDPIFRENPHYSDIKQLNISVRWDKNNEKDQNTRSAKVAQNLGFKEFDPKNYGNEWPYGLYDNDGNIMGEVPERSRAFSILKKNWPQALKAYTKRFA